MTLGRRVFLNFGVLAIALFIGVSCLSAQTTTAAPAKPTANPTPPPPVTEEEGVIKVNTDAVNVLFTAQDRNHRLITTLKPEDVRLFEDGKLQEIESFSRQ